MNKTDITYNITKCIEKDQKLMTVGFICNLTNRTGEFNGLKAVKEIVDEYWHTGDLTISQNAAALVNRMYSDKQVAKKCREKRYDEHSIIGYLVPELVQRIKIREDKK